MQITLKELAQKLEVEFVGDGEISLNHVCGVESIRPGGLAFLTNPTVLASLPTPGGVFDSRQKELEGITLSTDSALIVPKGTKPNGQNLIWAEDPLDLHVRATNILHDAPKISGQIHPSAVLGVDVKLGENVTIDANVVLYDNVQVGSNTIIRAGVVVMENSMIGQDGLIYPNVSIRENCRIGDRVIIHANVVLGADGFGFYQREGKNLKIPQIGTVIVGNDVEIGSGTMVDRARFYQTKIGDGCKLDNLIHIAHNVELGEDSLIAAQSGIAGSTTTGHHLMMGGQSGIRDNLKIGNHVTLLARTLITSKTGDQEAVAGMPSRPLKKWRRIQAMINNLDSIMERLRELEQKFKKFI